MPTSPLGRTEFRMAQDSCRNLTLPPRVTESRQKSRIPTACGLYVLLSPGSCCPRVAPTSVSGTAQQRAEVMVGLTWLGSCAHS